MPISKEVLNILAKGSEMYSILFFIISTVIPSCPELFLLCNKLVTLTISAASVGKRIKESENDPFMYEENMVAELGILEANVGPILVKNVLHLYK